MMSIAPHVADPSSDGPPDLSSNTRCLIQPAQQGKLGSATASAALPAPSQATTASRLARLPCGRSFAAHRRQLAPRAPADQRSSNLCHMPSMPPLTRGPSSAAFRTNKSVQSTPQHVLPRPRQAGDRPPPPTPATLPPRLTLSAFGSGKQSAYTPCSAPVSRLASTASRRGISIDVSLSKNTNKLALTSAGLPTRFDALSNPPSSNLLSVPAISTSKTISTTPSITPMSSPTFRRGLTVAIIVGDGEIVAESAPVTPRGPSSNEATTSSRRFGSCPEAKAANSPMADGASRQREIILCRYYHTEGLTCTSSPCRFVHSLDGIALRGSPSKSDSSASTLGPPSPSSQPTSTGAFQGDSSFAPLTTASGLRYSVATGCLSATAGLTISSPDPTHGTFARAQATTPLSELRLDDEALANIQSGEPVTLTDVDGKEVTGHVFKLSGGGKGAGGKSRAKFKTVPCRDYAESHCAYGDYCSFIHDPGNLYDPHKHGKKETKPASPTSSATKRIMSDRPSSDASGSTPSDSLLTPSSDVPPLLSQVVAKNLPAPSTTTTTSTAPIKTTPIAITRRAGSVDPKDVPGAPGVSANISPSLRVRATSYEPPFDAANCAASDMQGQTYTMSPAEYGSGMNSATWVEWSPIWAQGQWPAQQVPQAPWPVPVSPVGGMAVSPVSPLPPAMHGAQSHHVSGESSVVWTPSGWQVPDTAQRRPDRGFWRTKPCRLYSQGVCPHGDNCSFLHTTAPSARHTKTAPAKTAKTTPCKWFNSSTGCDQGEACSFKHVQVIPPEQQRAVPRPWRTQPCRHFQVGRCHQGDACHFAHVIAAVPPRSPSVSVLGSQPAWSGSQGSPGTARSMASSQASQGSAVWPDSAASSPVSELCSPVSPARAQAPLLATLEMEVCSPTSDPAQSAAPQTPVSPVSHRRASAPPTLPEPSSPSSVPPAAGALHSSTDTPQGAGEHCADWLATGRCQREDCRFAHCPASPLTEEHLSKACAQLRLMKRWDDDSDSEDEDDVEFVTVATHSTHSPTTMSARSISTSSL